MVETNRRLSEFSTFGIGGPIRYCVAVHSAEELKQALSTAKQQNLPFLVIGKGSNSLFSDAGFDGFVILNKIDHCIWHSDRVDVGAGYSFSLLGSQSARKGFSGLEFASGIPGSVGGAVFMNAGANGQDVAAVIDSVDTIDPDGNKRTWTLADLIFGYRTSPFQTMPTIIVGAIFRLTPKSEARETQLKIIAYRKATQPLQEKSIGCIFRNPCKALPAGALIEQCGLKGLSVGDAAVSTIHANFIINKGSATASDVVALIAEIRRLVYEQRRIELEPEIRII
ncbi:MAG: UDP-N-acetylenolpyruvoylglucosamine reductase [Chlamydiota bacterium]|jgi:UDP-N-acetylmuramate dehydrogenase